MKTDVWRVGICREYFYWSFFFFSFHGSNRMREFVRRLFCVQKNKISFIERDKSKKSRQIILDTILLLLLFHSDKNLSIHYTVAPRLTENVGYKNYEIKIHHLSVLINGTDEFIVWPSCR